LSWVNDFLHNRVQAVSVNGTHSTWGDVTSGVPQGSVLGPALFLLYVNDIQEKIQSNMRLFADDSIVYREIKSIDDHVILQRDLDALAEWSTTWLMHFNVGKCAILPITKKHSPSVFQYNIFGETLQRVKDHEYLGVTISHDLKWDKHCSKITKKANKTLGLLRRTLSPCSREVKNRAYQALVRSQLEYASEAWNPYYFVTTDRLDHVQRAAARFVNNNYRRTTSVTDLINKLAWEDLHTRRLVSQLAMFFKIHYGLVNIPMPFNVTPPTSYVPGSCHHSFKYAIPNATIDNYKFSFYPRSIRLWNQLPTIAVCAASPAAFKQAALPAVKVMKLPIGCRML